MRNRRTKSLTIDYTFLAILLIIIAVGLFMVYEASVVYSERIYGHKYHFVISQAVWMVGGLIGMFAVSRINLEVIRKFAPMLFFVSLVFLLLTLIPSIFSQEIYGARRWFIINPAPLPSFPIIGRVGFQPSELAKLASVIFFASFLSSNKLKTKTKLNVMSTFTIMLLLVVGLVMGQPDFTTAFVLGIIILGIFFLSNISIWYFLITGPLLALAAGAYAFSSDYRRARIQTLLSPEAVDNTGAGYHIRQVLIALGSGGFWGLGMGQSRQKYAYLPEVQADSIFAIIGEEFGFIGASLVIALIALLIWRGLKIAKESDNMFGMLIVGGMVIWIALQSIINLAAMVRLIPLTGVPLPLISYGGSATIFILLGLGLVLNISRKRI